MGKLEGKVAIITGAGSGLGEAGAILFAREGAKVVAAGRTGAKLDQTVATIKAAGGEAIAVPTDVRVAKDVAALVDAAIQAYGRIDILWNNAGILDPGGRATIETLTEEQWDETIDTNLKSIYLGCHFAVPHMKRLGGGVIINSTSAAGRKALAGVLPGYHASKGGVDAITRELAHELGSSNIRVNAISPSRMGTPMNSPRPTALTSPTPGAPKPATALRETEPYEVARMVVYLCSDEAGPLTGAIIAVDGGLSSK